MAEQKKAEKEQAKEAKKAEKEAKKAAKAEEKAAKKAEKEAKKAERKAQQEEEAEAEKYEVTGKLNKVGVAIVGDNVNVTSDGYGIQIQTYATGGVAGSGDCSIKLGKTIVEAKSSAVRVDSSSYGQKATVILGAGSILNSSANSAVYVTGKDSLLQIGDGSTVTGNSYGATGAALASSSA